MLRFNIFLIFILTGLSGLGQGSGDALEFDGLNDHVVISDAAALDIQEAITIEFWFLLQGEASTNDFSRPVSKGQSTNSNGAYGIFVRDVTNATDIGLRFIDAGGVRRDIRSTSVPNFNDGEWHHVAATYSNADDIGVLYVDGVIETSVSITGNTQIRTTADDLTIGTGNLQRFFNGQLDEVRIWNVARTHQEIREFMCAKLAGTETGLTGYWNLDAAATGAGNVADLTVNNLDGTMTNMDAGDVVTSGAPIGDESIFAYPQDFGGNALDFDGIDDYVDIGDVLIDGTGAVTVEAWIFPTAVPTNGSPSGHTANEGGIVHKNGVSDDNIGLSVSTGGLAFYVDNGSNNTLVGTQPPLNTWTHLAATYDGTNLIIYQDGVQDAIQASVGSGNFVNNTNSLRIGGGHIPAGSPFEFTGRIDEVRIWNFARTADEITNDMCRTLEGDETGLTGYWRLDELVNETVAVDAISGNNGTLTNMDASTDWVTADHTCGYTGFELYMASPELDSLRVSAVTGNPSGIHIYHVNEVPSSITDITGLGDNDQYFGVWKANGTSPTYTGTLFFDENDSWQNTFPQIETDLVLFTRDDNSVSSWTNATATLDAAANTLTATALSTEFILGMSPGGVLPIDLIDFQAFLDKDVVVLTWATASEQNNDLFVVERSLNGENWETVLTQPGAINSSQRIDYHDADPSPYLGTSFYRLKQVDRDGQFSHSEVRLVHFDAKGQVTVYPNPTAGNLIISSEFDLASDVQVHDITGRDVTNLVAVSLISSNDIRLDLLALPTGNYIVQMGAEHYRIVKR